MIGLARLGFSTYFCNMLHEISKFELYTYTLDVFSITETKYELEEIPPFSDNTPKNLENDIIGTRVIEAYKRSIRKIKH